MSYQGKARPFTARDLLKGDDRNLLPSGARYSPMADDSDHPMPTLRKLLRPLTLIALPVLAGCSAIPMPSLWSSPPPPAPPVAQGRPRVVLASWYGPSFAGRRTASGERFNENALTAASKDDPLGSCVRVTNLRNGRSVIVRINDRGPYVRGRRIDLSRGAAGQIGLTSRGVGAVRVTRLYGSIDGAQCSERQRARYHRRAHHRTTRSHGESA
jgi:rare lipoprotein A (RlpA)-like double-psi beta-barrel protein